VWKQSKPRNSFPASQRQAGVQPSLGKQGSITHNRDLGRQKPPLQMSPHLPSSSPSFYAEHDAIRYGMSLWSVGVSCPCRVPSQLLVHPQPARWWGGVRSRKSLDSVQALLSSNKNIPVLSTLFSYPKHSAIPATRKKINPVPAKTRTLTFFQFLMGHKGGACTEALVSAGAII